MAKAILDQRTVSMMTAMRLAMQRVRARLTAEWAEAERTEGAQSMTLVLRHQQHKTTIVVRFAPIVNGDKWAGKVSVLAVPARTVAMPSSRVRMTVHAHTDPAWADRFVFDRLRLMASAYRSKRRK